MKLFADENIARGIVFRDCLSSHGIILHRLDQISIADILLRLQSVWPVIVANLSGKFIVVTVTKIRVRPIPND